MSLEYACPACGEKNTVRFLTVGEAAQCPRCRAEHPVPEDAVEVGETRPLIVERRQESGDVKPVAKPRPTYPMFRALPWVLIIGSCLHVLVTLFAIGASSRMAPPWTAGIVLFLGFEIIMAFGVAQGIWAVLEILANSRAVLPPAVDAFD